MKDEFIPELAEFWREAYFLFLKEKMKSFGNLGDASTEAAKLANSALKHFLGIEEICSGPPLTEEYKLATVKE